jgi:hypothetical protein
MSKKIYYSQIPNSVTFDSVYLPIKDNKNTFSDNPLSYCPAWNHQNLKTFTFYASSNLHLEINGENSIYSDNLNQEEFDKFIVFGKNWISKDQVIIQIADLFSNFYWTDDKNIWISILPHPLTALNNNFYHCGAWFNLSNWPRTVNIGAIMVDRNKPLIIKRGDPLYNIKFHTENQNDKFDLIQSELDEKKLKESYKKTDFILNKRHSMNYDYQSILFESTKRQKCPIDFLWKNRFFTSFKK